MGLIKPAKVIISKASESRIRSLQAEEFKIQEKINKAKEDLESNKKAAEREGNRLIDVKNQVNDESKNLSSICDEISRKQSEKSKYDVDLKKIERCKKELEELAEKKTKNQKIEEQLTNKIQEKKDQLSKISSSIIKINLELNEKTKIRSEIDKEIYSKKDILNNLNKDLDILRKEKDQVIQDKKFIEKAKEEIPNYEVILKDIESSRSIKKSLTDDLKLLESHISSKKKELENVEKIIRGKRTDDFELTEKLGLLRREIAKENSKINSEKNKLITIKTEIQDLILEYRDKIKSEKLGKLVNQLNGN